MDALFNFIELLVYLVYVVLLITVILPTVRRWYKKRR